METIYWHLIEKRFCYDENIALYEDPKREEKNNNMFDNLAFYDSVAKIAGRAIVTIEPLPEKIITTQPTKDTKVDAPTRQNESNNRNLPMIGSSNSIPETIEKEIVTKTTLSLNDLRKDDEVVVRKSHFLTVQTPPRKKSLRERRLSKCLSLNLTDHKLELPVIRQSSIPKFYLDSPAQHQIEASIGREPCNILTSPVLPNSNKFDFDLKSVVQMEKERVHRAPAPVHRQNSRLAKIGERLKPLKIKRHASTMNLPHSISYI